MALLQYDIRVVGAANVDKALAGIEARIRAHNASVARMTGVTPAQARRASNPAAVASDVTRAARGVEQTDRRKVAIQNASFGMEQRQRAAAARAAEQAERRKTNIQNTSFRSEQRHRESEEKARARAANKEEKVRARAAVREQRLADQTNKVRTEYVKATLGHGYERVAGTVKAVGAVGATMLGIGGAGMAASSVADASRLDERARRLVIAGRAPGAAESYSPDQVRKQIGNLGISHGLTPDEVMGGQEKYVEKTGNLGDAMKFGDTFATAAQAAGASMTDIASIGAEMAKKFNIKTVEDMQQAFATLIFQGKKNAFVLKDMAPVLTEVMASMKGQAGLQGVGGMKTVGGLMQMAKEGTGSPESAATAIDNVLKQLVAKSDQIQGGDFGDKVQVFEGGDSKNPMRPLLQMFPELVASVKGDIVKLNDIFEIRGSRAFSPLTGAYRTAYADTKGTTKEKEAAGNEAVKKALANFVEAPGANFQEVRKDEASAMKSFAVQMETINSQFKQVMADELMPELMKLGPELGKLVPYVGEATKVFVELVKFLIDHPFASLAIVLGAQLAADFAAAKLGDLAARGIQAAVAKMSQLLNLPTGGGGVGGGGGMVGGAPVSAAAAPGFMGRPTAASVFGAVGTGVGIGLTVASLIVTTGLVNIHAEEAQMKDSGRVLNDVRSMNAPEDAGKARELLSEQEKKLDQMKDSHNSVWGQVSDWALDPNAGVQIKTQQAFVDEMTEQVKKLERLEEVSKQLAAAGVSQQDAAKQLNDVAKRLGLATPNRGNTPSPVKG